jgi:hypothetical protein
MELFIDLLRQVRSTARGIFKMARFPRTPACRQAGNQK